MQTAASSKNVVKGVTRYYALCILLALVVGFISVYDGSRALTFCVPSTSSTFHVQQQQQQQQQRVVSDDGISSDRSYELAKFESLRYFDDIDDVTWTRHQHRARTDHVYFKPTNPNTFSNDKARWLLFNVDPLFTCPNLRRVGGRGDGPKYTCDPHRLVEKPDCLIYSIGSKGIYKFEDGIVDILRANDPKYTENPESWLPNCEIHVFDPDPKYGRAMDPVKKNIHYHGIGLKSSYEAFQFGIFPTNYTFLSLPEIQARLGHSNRRIDVFKIDCEGCEWATYKDWLSPDMDIRQILIETHSIRPFPNIYFDRFLDAGMVPFSKEANSHPGAKPAGELFEWGFVRMHPNFLQRPTNLMNRTFV